MAEILTVLSVGWLLYQGQCLFQSQSTAQNRRRRVSVEGFQPQSNEEDDHAPYDDESPLTPEEMSTQVCKIGGQGRCIVRMENGEYVADLPDSPAAAQMIIELRHRMDYLARHIQKAMDRYDEENIDKEPWLLELKQWCKSIYMDVVSKEDLEIQVKRCKTFLERYPDIKLGEKSVIASSKLSSFTLAKKDITLCMRTAQKGNLYDLNTLAYVLLHELGHVMSDTLDHGNDFVFCFKIILRFAVGLGLYTQIDYAKYPVNYCGAVDLSATVFVRDLRI